MQSNSIPPGRLVLFLPLLLAPCWQAAAETARPAQSGDRRLPRPEAADGQRRVALTIGNDAYPGIPLKNAVNDARSVSGTLREIGFDVQSVENVDRTGLERAIKAFVGRLAPGDVGFFYFSGHGMQIEGENYLIPTDFAADDEVEAKFKAIPAEFVRERMERAGARLNVLVLDACRDNPYKASRSGSRGLARMEPGRGTVIVLATGPGKTASDNPAGRNGLFTHHLLTALKAPGLKLRDVFIQVRERVDGQSNHQQTPWVLDNVIGDFYLNQLKGAPSADAPSPADPGRGTEVAFWDSIKDSDRPDDFEAYLRQYPHGGFVELAKVRIARLKPRPADAVAAEPKRTALPTSSEASSPGRTEKGAIYSLGKLLARNVQTLGLTPVEVEPMLKGIRDGLAGRIGEAELTAAATKAQERAKIGRPTSADDPRTVYLVGGILSRNLKTFSLQDDEMETLCRGVRDSLSGVAGNPTEEEGKEVQAFAAARAATTAALEKKTSQAFLDREGVRAGAVRKSSGLIYRSLREGTGAAPYATSKVRVHYQGTLIDGSVFDSSVSRGQPASFPLNGVIPCWTEGLQLMRVGGKAQLICPSGIAYGDNGSPPKIKPGATLVFEVDLLAIED